MKLPIRAWSGMLAALGYSPQRQRSKTPSKRARRLRMESLESRQLLTATPLYWVGGASSNWNTTDANWSATSGGSTKVAWTNGDQAVFDSNSPAGPVSVNASVSADSVKISKAYTINGSSTVTLSGADSIEITAGISATLSAPISCSSAVSKIGTGTLTISGSFSGASGLTISAGTLVAGTSYSFSNVTLNATLDMNGNNLTVYNTFASSNSNGLLTNSVSGTATLNVAGSSTSSTYAGNIQDGNGGAGHVALTISQSTYTLTLSGNNTYTGATSVAGTLKAGSSTAFSSGSAYLTNYPGGILDLAGYNVNVGSLASYGGVGYGKVTNGYGSGTNTLTEGADGTSTTFGGVIEDGNSGAHVALTKTGAGTLTLGGANTYTGTTTLNAGAIKVNHSESVNSSGPLGKSAAANAGSIVFGGGTLQYSSSNTVDYSGRFSTAASQAISVDTNGQSVTFATALTSSGGSLAKLGTGTLTLSGSNTYTGTTTITQGTLAASSIVVSGSASNLGNATSALVLGGSSTSGVLSYTGNSANFTRGFTVNAGGGEVDVTTSGQTLTISSGGISASGTITIGGAGDSSISSVVSGSGGLTKTGAGTLTVSGSNTYTGATTVGQGTVSAGSIVVSGSASNLGNATSAVVLGAASTKGTLSYTGNSASYTRGFTVSAGGGEIDVTTSGQTLTIGTGGISASGALTLGGSGNATISSVVSGSGSLTKTGSGTLTLSGSNTYTGTTTISQGTLSAGSIVVSASASNLGNASSAVVLGAGGTKGTLNYTGNSATYTRGFTVNAGGGEIDATTSGQTLTIGTGNISDSSGSLTIGGSGNTTISSVLSGAGTLTKTGGGTLTLSGANTYTGTTTLSGGTVNLGHSESAGSSGPLGNSAAANPGSIVFSGGTLQYSASNTNDYSGRFSTAASQAISIDTNGQNVAFATALTSSGGTLTKTGTGTLTLTATNTYSGTTTISGGTLRLGDGSTYDGSVAGDIVDNAALVFANPDDQTYSGDISGTGTVTANGPGNLTIDGSNSYSGGGTVSAGMLFLGATDSGGSDSITVSDSAALTLVGTGITITGPATYTSAVVGLTIDTDSTPDTMLITANGIWGNPTEVDFYWDSNGNGTFDTGEDGDQLLGSADSGDDWTLSLTSDGEGGWEIPGTTIQFVANAFLFGLPIRAAGAGIPGVGGGFAETNPGPAGLLNGLPEFVPQGSDNRTVVIGDPGNSAPNLVPTDIFAQVYQDGVPSTYGPFAPSAASDSLADVAGDSGVVSSGDSTAASVMSVIGAASDFSEPGFGVSAVLSTTVDAEAGTTEEGPPTASATADAIASVAGNQTWNIVDSFDGSRPPIRSVEVQGYITWVYGSAVTGPIDQVNGSQRASVFACTVQTNDGHSAVIAVGGGDGNGVAVSVYAENGTNYDPFVAVDDNSYSVGMAFHWVMPLVNNNPVLNVSVVYSAFLQTSTTSQEAQGGGAMHADAIGTFYCQMSVIKYFN